ncbi:MAG: AAA family ATPase [Gallionella sp.]|nr:AAA family ATPase [Gallionella sp.]
MSKNQFSALEDRAAAALEKLDAVGRDSSPSKVAGDAKVLPRGFAPLPVVQLTCAADIKPEAIRWIWIGYIARGKFHVFAGMAGDGKTTIAIALVATISQGGRFPDGTRAPVGNVLIWSGEDSAQDTLVPRLLAAGADMSRVHFIGDVKHGDEIRSFDPATDIKAMADAATRIGNISLLIVDPVVNAVAGDSHKNGEVRRALQPLVELAEKLGCAVLGITHFSKGTGGRNPLERVTGSLAFGALARVVLATGKIDDGGTTKRIFCRAKSNIGPDDGGFEYDFVQAELTDHPGIFASSILWGNAVEGTARELLAEPDSRETGDHDNTALDDAKEFLRELLADGELPQKQIQLDAKGASHSWRTVERAKKELHVRSRKSPLDKCWYWGLTGNSAKEDEDCHSNNVAVLAAFDGNLDNTAINSEDRQGRHINCLDTFGGVQGNAPAEEVEL